MNPNLGPGSGIVPEITQAVLDSATNASGHGKPHKLKVLKLEWDGDHYALSAGFRVTLECGHTFWRPTNILCMGGTAKSLKETGAVCKQGCKRPDKRPDVSMEVGTHDGKRLNVRSRCEKCGTRTNWVVLIPGRIGAYWCGCGNSDHE